MEEMSELTQPETSDEISDENQNKLKETKAMDVDTDKHDSENRNTPENTSESQSCSLDRDNLSEIVPPGPSPFLLASLQSLVEENDHMLLPHSLHQIAEAYFLEEDYPWAVEFLTLEKLYHERLLSNLATIQEQWESQWKTSIQTQSNSSVSESEKAHLDSLSHICRTHQRPKLHAEKSTSDTKPRNSPTHVTEHGEQEKTLVNSAVRENRAGDCSRLEAEHEPDEDRDLNEEGEGQEENLEEDEYWYEELQEEQEDTDIDGQVPADELAKLIQIEEMIPSDGLVSILKKRVCVKGTDAPNPPKYSSKRKVRFREPDDPFDQDESTKKSCLILLLLCVVTVAISMGWTALSCLVGEGNSNACVDFSHNIDFYFGPVRQGVDIFTHWLSSSSSAS
nr:consortin, connexin sorting protein b [Misgurnus anguillicaudatus]